MLVLYAKAERSYGMRSRHIKMRNKNISVTLICAGIVFILVSAGSCSVSNAKNTGKSDDTSQTTPDSFVSPTAQGSGIFETQEPSEAETSSDVLRGIKTGDTVDKLFEAYDSGLLYQPGLQPDQDADFCVYDERFICLLEDEDDACIVFYVTDEAEGYKTIRGIKMYSLSDGEPVYPIDGETALPVDYEHIEAYLVTDTQVEELVHGLMKESETTPENAGKIIAALPEINWRIYSQLYDDGPTDFDDGPMDLIDWLYRRDITEENEILSILKATHGLDGAYSEGYSSILANIYQADPSRFIRQAGLLNPRQLVNVAFLLPYGLYDQLDEAVADLTEMAENEKLPAAEQAAAREILRNIDQYYSD
jgi:hypothetical protein